MSKSVEMKISVEYELDVLPPSARVVYQILKEKYQLYIGEITEESRYSRRTVQQALRLLEKSQIVSHYPDMNDLRRHKYQLV